MNGCVIRDISLSSNRLLRMNLYKLTIPFWRFYGKG